MSPGTPPAHAPWRPRATSGAVTEEVDGRLAVVPPGGAAVVFLNESASLIWSLCDGGTSEAELVSRVGELVGLASRVVGSDVRAALAQLEAAGLVGPGPAEAR